MRAAGLIQVHQGLLQTMPGCLGQPRVLILGVGQLMRLLGITNPLPAPAVFTALFQADVPNRPARAGDAIRKRLLLGGELQPKPPTGQHDSTSLQGGNGAVDHSHHQAHLIRHGPSFPSAIHPSSTTLALMRL
jgi:hypothetical protein